MHTLLALARHIHRLVYTDPFGLILRILGKYTTTCSWIILVLCLAAMLLDLRDRIVSATLWAVIAVLLYLGFQSQSALNGAVISGHYAWASIAAAALLVVLAFFRRFAKPKPSRASGQITYP